ncbi:DUF7471 family protein [Natronomonas amylolytica]|uniref:DUF7471 family protein n=1 Tax=Natronomonas amylolytica TaxID=3108498 RepID=UPI0030089437
MVTAVLSALTAALAGSEPVGASTTLSPAVYPVVVVAAAGTTLLFVLSVAVYWRRRSTPFFLVALAIGLLVVRSVVGFGTVAGVVPMNAHHVIAHGIDFLIAALVLFAAYLNRSGRTNRVVGEE